MRALHGADHVAFVRQCVRRHRVARDDGVDIGAPARVFPARTRSPATFGAPVAQRGGQLRERACGVADDHCSTGLQRVEDLHVDRDDRHAAEQRMRTGGEIRETRAHGDDHVRVARKRVRRRRAGDADGARLHRVVERQRALACLRFGDGHSVSRGKRRERSAAAVAVQHATARDQERLLRVAQYACRDAKQPLLIAGGGVLYSDGGGAALAAFATRHGVPVAETQAGKSALAFDDPMQAGAVVVTGAASAYALARDADVIIAVGTRLADFTTGSHALFGGVPVVAINVQVFDALKSGAAMVVGDAARSLAELTIALGDWRAESGWTSRARAENTRWRTDVDAIVARNAVPANALPYEGDVIGAVQRSHEHSPVHDIVVCAAGTLPAELHKLWRAAAAGGYHVEYGYSCMGYEIAGGLGVKMARPDREVVVMLGDGSYLMMNSEIATSVAMGRKLLIVVLDNRGFGCINRLQQACGSPPFNNLLAPGAPVIDFAAHARALGADAVHVTSIDALEAAMQRARQASKTQVIVIDTDPARTTTIGGAWWEVAVPEVSARAEVRGARMARSSTCSALTSPRGACASPTTITWAPTCNRRRTWAS